VPGRLRLAVAIAVPRSLAASRNAGAADDLQAGLFHLITDARP
jgi:hypothetical protein